MKKALVIALVLVMALSVVGLVSCAGTTYEGEYSYKSAYGETRYGCKVHVTVQGNVITNVTVDKDTDELYNLSAGWTNTYTESGVDTAGKTNWRTYSQAMAESFVGLTVEEVLGMKVYVNATSFTVGTSKTPAGQPITGNAGIETIKYIPEQLAVVVGGHTVGEDVELAKDAGATQSSARLILAVQDALLQAGGDVSKNPNCIAIDMDPGVTVTGECSYTVAAWHTTYGAKVDVSVKNGKISAVKLYEDDDTGWHRTTSSWTEGQNAGDLGFEKAEAAYADWLKTFVGKTPAEVLAIQVNVLSGEVTAEQTYGVTVTTESVAIAGATQSSARIIAAMQDALSKLA